MSGILPPLCPSLIHADFADLGFSDGLEIGVPQMGGFKKGFKQNQGCPKKKGSLLFLWIFQELFAVFGEKQSRLEKADFQEGPGS